MIPFLKGDDPSHAVWADDVRSTSAIRYGAYLCITVPSGARRAAAGADVGAVADRLGLRNEFHSVDGDPPASVAYLRRKGATHGQIPDAELLGADAVVHVAAPTREPVARFCAELARLVGSPIRPRILDGVVRPMSYTGDAMHNFAYAHRVVQQPAATMPNAFVVPMSKAAAWWGMDWMQRHTYFLPRYDSSGRMLHEGHALAAAAGIAVLLRRTYKSVPEPAPDGAYDFVNYFECADRDIPRFHEVMEALRDDARNPEWTFVREGPTWHGQRVATWAELFE